MSSKSPREGDKHPPKDDVVQENGTSPLTGAKGEHCWRPLSSTICPLMTSPCFAAWMAIVLGRPSTLLKPSVSIDGQVRSAAY